MDSTKNQDVPFLIVYPNTHSKNYVKEDLRSFQFRNAPIVVYCCPDARDEGEDNESQYTPSTQPLTWCNNEDTDEKRCLFCRQDIENTTGYYLCKELDERSYSDRYIFHKECIEPMKNSPYHPKHSLQILIFEDVVPNKVCYCCCREDERLHYCSICNFSICYLCAKKPPLLTIDHKKRHEHTLSYIPREASMTCDVCALDDRRYFIYVCHQCDFVVHKECIYFPSIIKISRHEHRLSFTYSFLHGQWFCGVCRKKVDENYGGYSCVKGCDYVVHSKCATQKNVWDGKELEGVPEEAFEDITPFKEISNDIIQHFSHKHHMKLHKDIDEVSVENNRCQACALPIYEGDLFSCVECEFVLHKVCAYLPLKKNHVTHRHPLVLKEGNEDKWFFCNVCNRVCNGFTYRCEGVVNFCDFVLDVHCAQVSEPFDYHCHPHLLFLSFKTGAEICSVCHMSIQCKEHLVCGECDFFLCFRCATLPKTFMYKHDEHPLIISYEQDASDQHWCDVCEKETYLKNGIYMCNECDVTLHAECLFGKDMFMLPDKMISTLGRSSLNNNLTRQICEQCHKHCHQNKIFYIINLLNEEVVYCSISCIHLDYLFN